MMAPDAPTVIVIDDDAGVRSSIQGLLKSAGLQSQAFESSEEFLRSNRSDGPTCLVLDVRLPGLTASACRETWITRVFAFPPSSSQVTEIFRPRSRR